MVPVYLSNKIRNNVDLVDYAKNELKLVEPRIVLDKLPMYSKLIFDGYPCIITGRSNDNIKIKNTIPLILNKEETRTLKDVIDYFSLDNKYIKRRKVCEKDGKVIYEDAETKKMRFNREMDNLYETYKYKLTQGVYQNRHNTVKTQVIENQEYFKALNEEKKTKILVALTKKFSNSGTTGVDLTYINGTKGQGTFTKSKNIEDSKVILLNESVTGLFVNRMEL